MSLNLLFHQIVSACAFIGFHLPGSGIGPTCSPLRHGATRTFARGFQQAIRHHRQSFLCIRRNIAFSASILQSRAVQTTHSAMPQVTDPFPHDALATGASYSRDTSYWNKRRLRRPSNAVAQPRRLVSKEERQRRQSERNDSKVGSLDEEAAKEFAYSFTALKDKVVGYRKLSRLADNIEGHLAPEACASTVGDFWSPQRPHSARSLIVLIIALLTVFGSLYTLVEYLLLATRASAACSVSTVYIPVTYTVTSGMSSGTSITLVSPVKWQ